MRNADRERLCLHCDAAPVQHRERVARRCGRWPARHDRSSIRSPPASTTPRIWRVPSGCSAMSISVTWQPKRYSPPSASIVARMLSTIVTSRNVPICGLLTIQDLRRRAGRDELGQHLAAEMMRVLDLPNTVCRRRTCRRRPRRTARCYSGFSTQRRHRPQVSLVRSRTTLAALQDDRRGNPSAPAQGGEQPARAAADHHRPVHQPRRCPRDEIVAGVRRRPDPRVARDPPQQRRFVAQGDVHRIDQADRRPPPRVVAAAGDGHAGDLAVVGAEPLPDGGAQVGLPMVKGQLQFGQSEHAFQCRACRRDAPTLQPGPPCASPRGAGMVRPGNGRGRALLCRSRQCERMNGCALRC